MAGYGPRRKATKPNTMMISRVRRDLIDQLVPNLARVAVGSHINERYDGEDLANGAYRQLRDQRPRYGAATSYPIPNDLIDLVDL